MSPPLNSSYAYSFRLFLSVQDLQRLFHYRIVIMQQPLLCIFLGFQHDGFLLFRYGDIIAGGDGGIHLKLFLKENEEKDDMFVTIQ